MYSLSNNALYFGEAISLLTQPSGKIKDRMKKYVCDIMTDIKYHANVQFLSQINLMHKPLSHISITGGF